MTQCYTSKIVVSKYEKTNVCGIKYYVVAAYLGLLEHVEILYLSFEVLFVCLKSV